MGCVSGLGAPPGAGPGLRSEASVGAMMEVNPRGGAGALLLLVPPGGLFLFSGSHRTRIALLPVALCPAVPRHSLLFLE